MARSLGDHDLLAKGCGIRVKEFLTPEPEVKVFDLSSPDIGARDSLVMGTDGLWDVLPNEEVREAVNDKSKKSKKKKCNMEEPGFEPGAFRMRSGHSTTELHPRWLKSRVWKKILPCFRPVDTTLMNS